MNKIEINHKYNIGDEVWTVDLCRECIALCKSCGKEDIVYRYHSNKYSVKEITVWRIIGEESNRVHVEYYLIAKDQKNVGDSQINESLVFGSQEEADTSARKKNEENKDE